MIEVQWVFLCEKLDSEGAIEGQIYKHHDILTWTIHTSSYKIKELGNIFDA